MISRVRRGYKKWRSGHEVILHAPMPKWVHFAMAAVGLAVVLLIAYESYLVGEKSAGFDRGDVQQVLEEAKKKNETLQAEVSRLQSIANVADTQTKLADSTQQKLTEEVARLTEKTYRLDEELALFEKLASADASGARPVSIYRFRFEPSLEKGKYYYQMLLAAPGLKDKDSFAGVLQIQADLEDSKGKSVRINWPTSSPQIEVGDSPAAKDSAENRQYKVVVKKFLRVSNFIQVPADLHLSKLTVHVLQNGTLIASATSVRQEGKKNVF